MEIIHVIIKMIWLMLPAYLANPAAAIAIKLTGRGVPVDFGKKYKGTRILGDGKTFKGFTAGIIAGIFTAIIQNIINHHILHDNFPQFSILSIIALSLGSMAGDLTASFFKRRMGFKRGKSFPFVDQLDFVFGAWILTVIIAPKWFFTNFTAEIIIAALILTPILHLSVNIIGYKMNISREPW